MYFDLRFIFKFLVIKLSVSSDKFVQIGRRLIDGRWLEKRCKGKTKFLVSCVRQFVQRVIVQFVRLTLPACIHTEICISGHFDKTPKLQFFYIREQWNGNLIDNLFWWGSLFLRSDWIPSIISWRLLFEHWRNNSGIHFELLNGE